MPFPTPPPLPDGCFALVPLEESTEALVRVVREFQPHVMITYDENGGYPHPDHVRCHEVSVAAFEAAADPERWGFLMAHKVAVWIYWHAAVLMLRKGLAFLSHPKYDSAMWRDSVKARAATEAGCCLACPAVARLPS